MESDVYSFADVELQDSSSEINKQLNRQLQAGLELTNSWIGNKDPGNSQIIAQFFKYFQSPRMAYLLGFQFKEFVKSFAIGSHETCIIFNDCTGWSKVERILLMPGESIFEEADYNLVTKTFLAPVINLCGYRIGADKITHFKEDGLQYFKGWMRGMSVEDLSKLSWGTETAAMGQTFTEALSRSDHQVNLIGLRYYQLFFDSKTPYVIMGPDRKLQIHRPIDICEFTSPLWVETTRGNENIFTGKQTPALFEAIKKRVGRPNPNNISKLDLINRTYQEPSHWDQFLAGSTGIFYLPPPQESIKYKVHQNAVHVVLSMPDLSPATMIPSRTTLHRLNP